MRVVHVAPITPFDEKAGGLERFVRDLLPALKNIGIHVVLFGVNKENSIATKNDKEADYEFIPLLSVKNNKVPPFSYYKGLVLKSKNVFQSDDIINLHRIFVLGLFIIIRSKKVLTIHIHDRNDMYLKKGKLIGDLNSICEKFILRRPRLFGLKKVIFVSKKLMDDYTSTYPEIKDISISIRTGIQDSVFRPLSDLEIQNARKKYNINNQDFVIISIGRLVEQKDITLLLDSFQLIEKKYKNSTLLIGGTGPLEDSLKKYANDLNLHNVKFLGLIGDKDLPALYGLSDLFALTSKYEGGPITLYEAIASGCPAVSTDVGIAKEVIFENDNGFVVEKRDAEAFADKIITIIENKNRYRNNTLKYKDDFSINKIAEQYKKVYDEISH